MNAVRWWGDPRHLDAIAREAEGRVFDSWYLREEPEEVVRPWRDAPPPAFPGAYGGERLHRAWPMRHHRPARDPVAEEEARREAEAFERRVRRRRHAWLRLAREGLGVQIAPALFREAADVPLRELAAEVLADPGAPAWAKTAARRVLEGG